MGVTNVRSKGKGRVVESGSRGTMVQSFLRRPNPSNGFKGGGNSLTYMDELKQSCKYT